MKLIVAIDKAGGIGINNTLPWHNAEDLAHFRKKTTGNVVIMGRKTFDSLPNGPLPNRTNVVFTRNPDFSYKGVYVVDSVAALKALCLHGEHWVIGGCEVCRLLYPYCDEIQLTVMQQNADCDRFFQQGLDFLNKELPCTIVSQRTSKLAHYYHLKVLPKYTF